MKIWLLFGFCLSYSWSLWGQTNGTFLHDGLNRSYVYYTPSTWNSTSSMPLLLVLHGLTQTGAGVMDITQFNQLAESNGFIACYPDGINNAWNANMNITVSTADDQGFLEQLALYFQQNFNTDPTRQYLVGFSNGGFMSHKMACESDMCFAAIASVSGNMSDTTYNQCAPSYQPALLHIHGTNDLVVPYNGGSQTGVSVDQTMNKWKSFLSCDPNPSTTAMPNNSLTDLSSPTLYTYQNCSSALKLIKITGGGHQWPGINTLVGGAGIINMDFYSPQVIWDFLSSKSCPSAGSLDLEKNAIKIFPNPATAELHLNGIASNAQIVVYSNQGKVILASQGVSKINISELANGVYFLDVRQGDRLKRLKWVKN